MRQAVRAEVRPKSVRLRRDGLRNPSAGWKRGETAFEKEDLMNKRHWFALLAVMVALVVVGACNKSSTGASCPDTGVAPSSGTGGSGTPYIISVGTTYQSNNLNAGEYFQFTTSSAGNYSGCIGSTAKTDLAYDLYTSGISYIATCDDNWEDHPDEKCSTSAAGITLSGSTPYLIYSINWGPIYGGAPYTITVTKD